MVTRLKEQKPEDCRKVDDCHKMTMILDKDLVDFQYRQAAEAVCSQCNDFDQK